MIHLSKVCAATSFLSFQVAGAGHTFGHIETAFLQLSVLLAQRTSFAAEMDAAVPAGRFLQVVLRSH